MESAEICLNDEPFAISLEVSELSKFCHYCLSQRNKRRLLKRCAKCNFVYYCSVACQTSDWKDGHQVECRRVVRLHQVAVKKADSSLRKVTDSLVRLVARVIDKLHDLKQYTPFDPLLQSFVALRSIMLDIASSPNSEQRERFDEFADSYAQFVERDAKKIDKVGLLTIYSKIVRNRIELKDTNQIVIGVGLYPNLCKIGHSCRPTAAVVFRGRTAVVVPTRSKYFPSPLRWSDLSRCYLGIDPLSTIQTRRDKLKAEYFLDCHCVLCEDAAANETMEAFSCSKKSCHGRVIPVDNGFICSKCGWEADECFREKFHQAVEHVNSLSDLETSHQSLKCQLNRILSCIQSTQPILHKYNIKRLTILRAAYNGCVLEKRFKEATNFGRQSLEIYRHYMGEFDPFLVAFMINLVTTYVHAGEINAANQLVHSVIDRCEHIYGKESDVLNYLDSSFEEMLAKLYV